MKVPNCVLTPDQREQPLNVLGTRVTILASSQATQSYGITYQEGDEGMGPPPQPHAWDVSLHVLKGEIEFLCDGKEHVCVPGTLVHVPGGSVHGFRYGRGGGQMLEITGAGSFAAQMFTAVNAEIPPGSPDTPRVLEVLGRNGVTVEE